MIRSALVIAGIAGLLGACGPADTGPPAGPAATQPAAVAPPADDEQTVTLADGVPGLPGQRVYEQVCAKCHDQGTDSAPQIGAAGDWSGRSDLWQAVLFEHANKGYLDMPAKGGEEGLTEADVAAAAEYMLDQSFPNRSGDPR